MKTLLTPALFLSAFLSPPGLISMARADEPLKVQLESRAKESASQTAEATRIAYAAGIKAVGDSGITQSAKQTGDPAPDFTLPNAAGEKTTLSTLLKKGPVVLTWYRGGWCPYCNLTLRALQKVLPEFQSAGAQLVALTPELPDKAAATSSKHQLEFEVLTDLNHQVARSYGVVFQLTPEVRDLYRQKFNLTDFNGAGAGDDQLPLAATYIIGQDGIIRYAFLHADYRERAGPETLVSFLKANRKNLTTQP